MSLLQAAAEKSAADATAAKAGKAGKPFKDIKVKVHDVQWKPNEQVLLVGSTSRDTPSSLWDHGVCC